MSENRQITDTNYDKSLAVRCVNGTFVGRREGNIISYMTIPASVYPSWFLLFFRIVDVWMGLMTISECIVPGCLSKRKEIRK